MVLRIEYLVEKEIFSMAQVKEELELAQNLQDLAFRMKALVLRYRFTQESSIEDKISTYLEEMETKEKVLIMNLVNRLKALKDD